MLNRRTFLTRGFQTGFVAATSSLWRPAGLHAFAELASSPYKAVVIVELPGGNDANNMLIPIDSHAHLQYAGIRGCLTQPVSSCLPLQHASGDAAYGLHSSMPGVSKLYNDKKALFVANVGPIKQLVTKQQLLANPSFAPALFSHPSAAAQWESALTTDSATTGWGGRLADLVSGQSGTLPPVLNGGYQNLFTVGETVQEVAVQGGGLAAALDPMLEAAINRIAQADARSANALVAETAKLRISALDQQAKVDAASTYTSLTTRFPNSVFGSSMLRIAQMIGGRSVIGASRQIFFVQQGSYDSHTNQLDQHASCLADLDAGLTAFMAALDELSLTNQVLVCTVSDFNRTCTPNVEAGSDHGWGSHQIVLGGGIQGGRILGKMPTMELNGPDDLNGLGAWIPTTAVTQFTAGVGAWMGLNTPQMTSVFPELGNFASGALNFLQS